MQQTEKTVTLPYEEHERLVNIEKRVKATPNGLPEFKVTLQQHLVQMGTPTEYEVHFWSFDYECPESLEKHLKSWVEGYFNKISESLRHIKEYCNDNGNDVHFKKDGEESFEIQELRKSLSVYGRSTPPARQDSSLSTRLKFLFTGKL